MAKYSKMLAEKMGLSAEECENVYYMGLLHDVGKIGVPNEIINKPTKLSDEVVREELEKNMGTQFDPEVAKCMIALIDDDTEYVLHES